MERSSCSSVALTFGALHQVKWIVTHRTVFVQRAPGECQQVPANFGDYCLLSRAAPKPGIISQSTCSPLCVFDVQFNVLSDRFMVESRDVIGWTNKEDYSLISFNLDPNYKMRFYDFVSGAYPTVNQTVALDSIVYPAVFSVAVEIVQRWCFAHIYTVSQKNSRRDWL